MTMLRPARKFSFVIEGVLGPNPMTDDEMARWILGVRNLILMLCSGAMANVPMQSSPSEITITPAILPADEGGFRGKN